jgi:hypothetical protein
MRAKEEETVRRGKRTFVASVGRFSILVGFVVSVLLAVGAADAQMNRPFHKDGWILSAAHTPGLASSIWRTDLWIVARTHASNQKITLYFCKSETDNSAAPGFEINNLGVNTVTYLEDVVEQYVHVGSGKWLGAIHYVATGDVQVWARVYSITPDGSASFGQLVEGIPTKDMSPDSNPWWADDHQWLYAMKHTSEGRFRVNIGVVNPTAVASSFDVIIYNDKGGYPTMGDYYLTVTVPPFSMRQLGDPFAGIDGGNWNNYTIRISCTTEGGGSFAYASVVDNATNDGYFVRGVKLYPPS